MFSYLTFLLRSTNQHGVHSPFVYELVTRAFYGKNQPPLKPRIDVFINALPLRPLHKKLLARVSAHLRVSSLATIETVLDEKTALPDLVFVSKTAPRTDVDTLLANSDAWARNDTILVFDTPYADKERLRQWKAVTHHPCTTAVVDTYGLGFVFFRKEQQKQYFRIRT